MMLRSPLLADRISCPLPV